MYPDNASPIQDGIDSAPRHCASQATAFVLDQDNADKVSEHLPLQAEPVQSPVLSLLVRYTQLTVQVHVQLQFLSFWVFFWPVQFFHVVRSPIAGSIRSRRSSPGARTGLKPVQVKSTGNSPKIYQCKDPTRFECCIRGGRVNRPWERLQFTG